MANTRTHLTELEGAILTEIGHRGNATSFKVRRAFELSPSTSWSGSAGAVYPAIRRLTEAGQIDASPSPTKRGTTMLALTEAGAAMLDRWLRDAATACSIGIDPFRLRVGLWSLLPAADARSVAAAMRAEIHAELAKLTSRGTLDPVEQAGNEVAIGLQHLRLAWLDAWQSDLPSPRT